MKTIATASAGGNTRARKKRLPENITAIEIRIGRRRQTFLGRDAWCLGRLVEYGERGVTPIERPAPRWSHYVYKLRRAGVDVDTIPEGHAGAYAGRHARYVLRSPVEVLAVVGAA